MVSERPFVALRPYTPPSPGLFLSTQSEFLERGKLDPKNWVIICFIALLPRPLTGNIETSNRDVTNLLPRALMFMEHVPKRTGVTKRARGVEIMEPFDAGP